MRWNSAQAHPRMDHQEWSVDLHETSLSAPPTRETLDQIRMANQESSRIQIKTLDSAQWLLDWLK